MCMSSCGLLPFWKVGLVPVKINSFKMKASISVFRGWHLLFSASTWNFWDRPKPFKLNIYNHFYFYLTFTILGNLMLISEMYWRTAYRTICIYLLARCKKLGVQISLWRCSVILETCYHQFIHHNLSLNLDLQRGNSDVKSLSESLCSHMQSRVESCFFRCSVFSPFISLFPVTLRHLLLTR